MLNIKLMIVRKGLLSVIIAILYITSCNQEKKVPVYKDYTEIIDSDVIYDSELVQSNEDLIRIPFRVENGVKYIHVNVNGIGLEMIFDTGCSNALISVAEANYLYQKGKLTENDIVGFSKSQIADGSIVENMVVNLREVALHNEIICLDVHANVSSNINAPLLLGNEVLDRVANVTIDNEDNCLIFKLR